MTVVFATGEPGQFNFDIAESADRVPAGARILAICGKPLIETLDEGTFYSMSNVEFYAFTAWIREANKQEQQSRQLGNTVISKVFRWMVGR